MINNKYVNGIQISRLITDRYWVGSDLIKKYKYFCRYPKTNEILFTSENLEEAVNFCNNFDNPYEINKNNTNTPKPQNINRPPEIAVKKELLLDIQSLLENNLPDMISENTAELKSNFYNAAFSPDFFS